MRNRVHKVNKEMLKKIKDGVGHNFFNFVFKFNPTIHNHQINIYVHYLAKIYFNHLFRHLKHIKILKNKFYQTRL
jgi:hypothetical protein